MTTEEVLIGCCMIALSGFCLLVNGVVLSVIALNPEFTVNSSYKIMLFLGVCDVVQLVIHMISGLFTILQYQATYWVGKMLGVIISPCYECYVFITILLAFNRFVLLCCPLYEKIIFSSNANRIWIGISIALFAAFALPLSSNQVNYGYSVTEFKWSYDLSFSFSHFLKTLSMFYQIIGMFVAWAFYIAITISLIKYRKKVDLRRHYHANRKILFQAFVLTVYCTIQNFCWHKGDDILPASFGRLKNFLINMMWIGNAGMNSFICLFVNKLVRQKLCRAATSRIRCCFGVSAALFWTKNAVKRGSATKKQANTLVSRKSEGK